jgi:hypothetical protein
MRWKSGRPSRCQPSVAIFVRIEASISGVLEERTRRSASSRKSS